MHVFTLTNCYCFLLFFFFIFFFVYLFAWHSTNGVSLWIVFHFKTNHSQCARVLIESPDRIVAEKFTIKINIMGVFMCAKIINK